MKPQLTKKALKAFIDREFALAESIWNKQPKHFTEMNGRKTILRQLKEEFL